MSIKITERIKAWRVAAGLTQAQAAVELGIGLSTLQHWEQGQSEPRGIGRVALDKWLSENEAEAGKGAAC